MKQYQPPLLPSQFLEEESGGRCRQVELSTFHADEGFEAHPQGHTA